MALLIGTLLPLLVLAPGCQSSARVAPMPVAVRDETAELLQHPQFKAAAIAAPEFTAAALAKIRQLAKDKAQAGIP